MGLLEMRPGGGRTRVNIHEATENFPFEMFLIWIYGCKCLQILNASYRGGMNCQTCNEMRLQLRIGVLK